MTDIDYKFITQGHVMWAAANKCIIMAGQCGFGRDCVGLMGMNEHWVDYCNMDVIDNKIVDIPGAYDGWVPPDAYHKHNCVAVLGQEESSWRQLSEWLDCIIHDGWHVEMIDRPHKDVIDVLINGLQVPRLVRS